MQYTQPQIGPFRPSPKWLARKLKFALLPPAGLGNCVNQILPTTPGGFVLGTSNCGVVYDTGGARVEYGTNIDTSRGFTLISIWRGRVGGNYLGSDGQPVIASTRTAGNQGWSWGHHTAIGGGSNGNVVPQTLTFQGVVQYTEANATIEAFVDTPVAVRYDPSTGLISWFRLGAKSSPDTAAGVPSAGGTLILGAQGPLSSNSLRWLDRFGTLLIFETPLSDAEINSLTKSTSAVWQVFNPNARPVLKVSVSNNIVSADGSSAGSASVSAISAAIQAAYGASAGTAVTGGVARALFRVTGGSNGAAGVSGTAVSIMQATGSTVGSAGAAASSVTISTSNGSATGTATLSGNGAAIWRVDGSSAGIATVAGQSNTVSSTIGAAGNANGTSEASAVGAFIAQASGAASGNANVLGEGRTLAEAIAQAVASSTGSANGAIIGAAVGAAAGSSGTQAVVAIVFESAGMALGAAEVEGVAASIRSAIGRASGYATVSGITEGGIHYTARGDEFNITLVFSQYEVALANNDYSVKLEPKQITMELMK